MKLIAGLGNPGPEYEKTRHNAGFMAVEYLQKALELPEMNDVKKVNGHIVKGKIERGIVALLKPDTFMNESGTSVAAAINFYKIRPENLILIHDDKDIPIGETRVQKGRGDAGHNGVKSVIQSLGTNNFVRIRIGIMQKDKKIPDMADFVLSRFSPTEQKTLKTVFEHVLKEVQGLV